MAKPQYRGDHLVVRAAWQPIVDAGEANCAELICLERRRWIRPGSKWDLAHDRANGGYLGPAHQRCNRSEGATYRNQLYGNRWPRRRPRADAAWSTTMTSDTWSSREW